MQDLTKLSDRELVVAYANDSNEAFDILLERHKNRVYTYILHIVKNKDLADDIFQETFVKAIMTIRQGRYAEHGKFSGWLTRIAHNLIIDYFRQEKVENTFRPTTKGVTCSTAATYATAPSRTRWLTCRSTKTCAAW